MRDGSEGGRGRYDQMSTPCAGITRIRFEGYDLSLFSTPVFFNIQIFLSGVNGFRWFILLYLMTYEKQAF
jgi:hypothetical protein